MTSYKDKRIARRLIQLCTCFLLLTNKAGAQLHAPNQPENRQLVLAEELFLQQQYKNAALKAKLFLQQPVETTNHVSHSRADKAKYFIVTSALKLNEPDGEKEAADYVNTTANPAYKQRVAYALAQNYFRKNMFREAIGYYELAGFANLNNNEIIDAKFELAYCYFNNSQFNQ